MNSIPKPVLNRASNHIKGKQGRMTREIESKVMKELRPYGITHIGMAKDILETVSRTDISGVEKVGEVASSPVEAVLGRAKRVINQSQGRMNNSVPDVVRDLIPNVSAKIEEVLPNVQQMKEAIGAQPLLVPVQRKEKGPVPSSAPSGSGQNPPSPSLSSAPTFNTRDMFRQIKDFI